MKDIYGYGEKITRNSGKMVIYESQILRLTLYIYMLQTNLQPVFG